MQALEFVTVAGAVPTVVGKRMDGRNRMGVMGRELWVEHIACPEQRAGAGQVGHIGAALACEHRVTA